MKKINSTLLLFLSTSLMTTMQMTITQADVTGDSPPDADFLEFLAEVDEASGEGFETWLKTITSADTTNDIANNTQTNNAQTDKQ